MDAERALDDFYKTCSDAGDLCPLSPLLTTESRSGDADNTTILRRRVNEFLQSLESDPVITTDSKRRAQFVTSSVVRRAMFRVFYDPVCRYEGLATILADSMLNGNHTTLIESDKEYPGCPEAAKIYAPIGKTDDSAHFAILCGDSAAVKRNKTRLKEDVDLLQAQSPTFGAGLAEIGFSCINWGFRAKYALNGPFASPASLRDPGESQGGTSKESRRSNLQEPNTGPAAPLLILSSRIDHVTSLANACALSHNHIGSSVVIQESVEHCALGARSKCTRDIVQEYFNTGRVPANGTTCIAEIKPAIPRVRTTESVPTWRARFGWM